MRVFITGAAGFGASGLVRRLLERGDKVTALDIIAPLEADRLSDVIGHPNLTYLWKSVHDVKPEDIEGHGTVLHLAASADVPFGYPSPYHACHNNIMGTVALLEACRQVEDLEKVVLAGSANELGRPKYLPIDEKHPLVPVHPYGFSKVAQEMAFIAWRESYGVPSVILSNGVVIGENMRKEIFIFKWLYNILRGKPITVEGEPIADQTRDVTYVGDTTQGWLLVIDAPAEKVVGEKFIISYGTELAVEEIAKMCMEVCQREVPIIRKPYRPGERGMRECFSNEKAKRILGYEPKIPPYEAIRRTKEWIEQDILKLISSSV